MNYRREIDGLRALAVVPVILYHAGFRGFSGGFVGVDVFFVISGYLITSIMLGEFESGSFSIAKFYERRARRILPALFLVMAVAIPFAWLWLLPGDMAEFSQSMSTVTVFASNIFFWRGSGYFDTAAELKPLLHTWSLAVEEQFYILFPLFLRLTWRLGRRRILLLLAGISVLSLGAAQWGAFHKPAATFFLLPTRSWELAIGAGAAFYLSKHPQPGIPAWMGQALALGGVLLIGCGVFGFDERTPFPSLYALVPTVGTAFVILFAWPTTWAGRLLGGRGLVGIGLLSYSAYLWHQPLFAFARHRSLTEPPPLLFLALCVLTVGLSYLSWRFVEQPFRNKAVVTRSRLAGFSLVGSLVFFGLGFLGQVDQGLKFRHPPEVVELALPVLGKLPACNEDLERLSGSTCTIGDTTVSPSMALLGDSHSTQLTKALDDYLKSQGKSMVVYAQSWCPPLLDFATPMNGKRPGCRQFMKAAYDDVIGNAGIRDVVLVSEWAHYTQGMRWGDKFTFFYTDSLSKRMSLAENEAAFGRALQRTRDALVGAHKRVFVVKSVPEYDLDVPTALAKRRSMGQAGLPEADRVDAVKYRQRNEEVERAFTHAQLPQWATVIDPFAKLCGQERYCRYAEGNRALYTDGNHLSYDGSLVIVEALVPSITP